jgi:hypothetical protein
MAILPLFIRPCDPCIFATFKSTIFKFWILLEYYIKINETFAFDSLSISSEIELGLGPYEIKIFFIILHHFLRIFPISLRVIYFGSSNHKKKINKKMEQKKQNGEQNQNGRQA